MQMTLIFFNDIPLCKFLPFACLLPPLQVTSSKIPRIQICLRPFSYEPGNGASLVTGKNFVVCSYGTFQPGRPGQNIRNKNQNDDRCNIKLYHL